MRFASRAPSIIALLAVSLAASAWQRGRVRRDPMTDAEIEQMREYRDDPPKRLHAMSIMLQKRTETLRQIETDPKAVKPEERGTKLHDQLEDLTNLIDEFDDNVDLFAKGGDDIRKSLTEATAAETALQTQLQTMQTADKNKPQFEEYSFPLADALEAVTESLPATRDAIATNEEAIKTAKKAKKSAK